MAITIESSRKSAKQTATLASVHFFRAKKKDPTFSIPFNDDSQFKVATAFYTWLIKNTNEPDVVMTRQSQLKTAIEQMEVDTTIATTKDVLATADKLYNWINS